MTDVEILTSKMCGPKGTGNAEKKRECRLALTIIDIKERKELFVVLLMVGITLASNPAVGFIIGIALAYALKSNRLKI